VIAELQHDISGLIAVNPEGRKMARAQAVIPQCESGNVYLPHPAIAPWIDGRSFVGPSA
jgi:phage terminase large subunit-like protein